MPDEQMNTNVLETMYIKDEISKCEDLEELKDKTLPMIKGQQEK